MRILVIYHSGVGNTKLIAEMLSSKLNQLFVTDIMDIEKIQDKYILDNYDGYIIGFPTYHTHPSFSIIEFINNIEKLRKSKPAYIFTTCGWYSANTLRIFHEMCIVKNIIPVLHQSYRCTATDGSLIAPFIKWLFTFEKNLVPKVECEAKKIKDTFNKKQCNSNLPPFKWYSILNYPNKKVGQLKTFNIFLHKNSCNKCGKCVKNCIRNAMRFDKNNYPLFFKGNCENCYRCIHHCLNKALSLSKRKVPKKQLSESFFQLKKREFL